MKNHTEAKRAIDAFDECEKIDETTIYDCDDRFNYNMGEEAKNKLKKDFNAAKECLGIAKRMHEQLSSKFGQFKNDMKNKDDFLEAMIEFRDSNAAMSNFQVVILPFFILL